MRRCCTCNAVCNDDELGYRKEYVGEFWGSPSYHTVDICPECGSDELEDFEVPYEDCPTDYCDYECEDCDFARRKENEEIQN